MEQGMNEKSLIAFTILSQLAAGLFWSLSLLYAWALSQAGPRAAHELFRLGLPAVVLLSGAGILAAFFHLGAPARAWRALSNLRRSWLSREILCAVLFGVVCTLLVIMEWLNQADSAGWTMLLVSGWLASLGLIYAMASAYRLRTVPAWNTWITPASFIATAMLLGALACGALLVLFTQAQPSWANAFLRSMALSAAFILAAGLALQAAWLTQLQGSPAAIASFSKIAQKHVAILKLRFVLAAVAIATVCFTLAWPRLPIQTSLWILAFVLALSTEIAGRILFYNSRVRSGV
jgi:anaerobic dimethyl sulfoxide reductase subunit C